MLLSTMVSGVVSASQQNSEQIPQEITYVNSENPIEQLTEDNLQITSPEPGFLYLYQLQPIQMPISTSLNLGIAVVIGRSLQIETAPNSYDHAKFVATRIFTNTETVRWDYRYMDGLDMDMDISSGLYFITVYAYDEFENMVDSDSIKVLFIKAGRSDYGVWVNTRYDNGEAYRSQLNLGISDFRAMLETGETKNFKVSMQSQDDTDIQLRFTRTKILESGENVIEARFNVDTECDTSRDYETSVEVRFPHILLNGGEPSEDNNPYFSAKVGYFSTGITTGSPNRVDTTFYFGKDSLLEPAVFRMKLTPDSLDPNSELTFFNNYLTVDELGNEVFQRMFTVAFAPATELTITTIPRQAKIQYDFGASAGTPTQIAFRAEGGVLDDIIQRFMINPLPSFMSFDLTIIGDREFLYQSDRTYDATYALDSEQNGNLVTFAVDDIPERIHATWGIQLGDLGDLKASSYAELNMSHDVSNIALSFFGNEIPFISLDNLPRKIRFENAIDILGGVGNVTIYRGIDEVRDIDVTITYDEVQLIKSFSLQNNFVQISWDIDTSTGIGTLDILRDSNSEISLGTTLTYGDWMFSNTLILRNTHLQLHWDVNRAERRGIIEFSRDQSAGNSVITTTIGKNDWSITNSLELKHTYIEFYWDLPSSESNHGELGMNTNGDEFIHNTLSVMDGGTALLSLGIGIQTNDHIHLGWDNNNGLISNFEWSGNILKLADLTLAVNLPGDLMTINAAFNVGEQGALQLELNKPVDVQFVNVETSRFKIDGHVKFNPNSPIRISWKWGQLGYFTVNTFGQNIGDDFGLKLFWDPANQGNYKYGFNVSAPSFLNTYLNISWFKAANQTFPTIWIIGNPFPGNWGSWHRWLLWDYQWWHVS